MIIGRPRLSAPLVAILTAAVLLALFITDMLTVAGINASRGWIGRTQQAQTLIGAVRAELLDAETGELDFLLTGRSEYLDAYEAAMRAVPASLANLRRITADDAVQQRNVDALESFVAQKMAELRTTLVFYRRTDFSRALAVVRSDEAAALMGWTRQLIAEMRAREDSRLEEWTSQARRNLDAALWIDVAALGGLLVLGLVLFVINRDIGRRQALEKALRDQAALQEQFIAILGHDLRNPLNAVLMAAHRLKQAEVSERWAKSVDYVFSGARRMARLVEQLLDLARVRQAGGIPVRRAPGKISGRLFAWPSTSCGPRILAPSSSWRRTNPFPGRVGFRLPGAGRIQPHRGTRSARWHGTRRRPRRAAGGRGDTLQVHNAGPPIPADVVPRILLRSVRAAGR